jgi:nicotinamidase-related amidase
MCAALGRSNRPVSNDREPLLNNVIALAKTARAFGLPVVVSTSATKVYSGPLMPAIQAVVPGVVSLKDAT